MICLTSEQRTLLTARLAEAEAAYHSIMLGGGVKVFVDQNGERIEYQSGNIRQLSGYIQGLKQQLGLVPAGPMSVYM